MAVDIAAEMKVAALDAQWTEIGASPVLEFRTGSKPAALADARTGTVLALMNLPSTPMAAAVVAGTQATKSKSGTWSDATADASGTLGYWTLYKADGTTKRLQGTVGVAGSGADIIVSAAATTVSLPFTILTFVHTQP